MSLFSLWIAHFSCCVRVLSLLRISALLRLSGALKLSLSLFSFFFFFIYLFLATRARFHWIKWLLVSPKCVCEYVHCIWFMAERRVYELTHHIISHHLIFRICIHIYRRLALTQHIIKLSFSLPSFSEFPNELNFL